MDEKRKILTVFDDMITNIINKKKLNPVVTKLFINQRQKIKHFNCLYFKVPYFKVPRDARLNSTHFFIIKIPNIRKL